MIHFLERFRKTWGSLAPAIGVFLIAQGYVTDTESQALLMGSTVFLDLLWRVFGPANREKKEGDIL